MGLPGSSVVKNLPARAGDAGDSFLGGEDPLEGEMTTHSSILAWRIPWTQEADYGPWGHSELDTAEHRHFAVSD